MLWVGLVAFLIVAGAAGWSFRHQLLRLNDKTSRTTFGAPVDGDHKLSIDRFAAEPETIDAGQSAQLVIGLHNATSATVDQGVGSVLGETGVQVHPDATTTYHLTASGTDGSKTGAVTVTVRQPSTKAPVIEAFQAAPSVVPAGQAVMLSWSVSDAAELSIDPDVGVVKGSKVEVTPKTTTTYTLKAKGPGGTASRQTEVTVHVPVTAPLPPPPPRPMPPHVDTFRAEPPVIEYGQSTKLYWSVNQAVRVTIDQGVGDFTPTNQTVVQPSRTTTYTLTAHGPGGEAIANTEVTVTVPAAPPPPPPKNDAGPASGVFHCPNVPIHKGQEVKIENLPNRRLKFEYDNDSWAALPIEIAPNGTKILRIVSKRAGIQTFCEVKWKIID